MKILLVLDLPTMTWGAVFFNNPLQLFGLFVNLVFLGQAFTIMLVYVWSRRNPYVRMNFFGLLIFQAPFLPWVLMGFSLLLGNSIIVDLLGKQLQESQGSVPASVIHETRCGKTQGLNAFYLVPVLYTRLF